MSVLSNKNNIKKEKKNMIACFIFKNLMIFDIRGIFFNKVYKSNKFCSGISLETNRYQSTSYRLESVTLIW